MGTFHHDKGELHGLTVLVETEPGDLWVGRCDTVTEAHVILLGADAREAAAESPSRDEWLRRITMVGFHPRHARVALPKAQVASIQRLSELQSD